jgi:hypothetical protein
MELLDTNVGNDFVSEGYLISGFISLFALVKLFSVKAKKNKNTDTGAKKNI